MIPVGVTITAKHGMGDVLFFVGGVGGGGSWEDEMSQLRFGSDRRGSRSRRRAEAEGGVVLVVAHS